MKKKIYIEKVSKDNFTVNVTTAGEDVSSTMKSELNLAYYVVNAVIKYKGIPVDTIKGSFYTERLDDDIVDMIQNEKCYIDFVENKVSKALFEMMQYRLDIGFTLDEIFGDQVMELYMETICNKLHLIDNQEFTNNKKLLQDFQSLYCLLYRHGFEYHLMFHHDINKLFQDAMELPCFDYLTGRRTKPTGALTQLF